MELVDTFIVYKFIRLLTTPWDETEAFTLGVIDGNGKRLKNLTQLSHEQSKAYTLFHRLVFNIKRLIEKVPGGKTKIGTYAAALYLLKEQVKSEEGKIVLDRSFMRYLDEENALDASYLEEQYLPEDALPHGNYTLANTMLDTDGEHIVKGTHVVAKTDMKPMARILGVDVFEVTVVETGKLVMVSHEDLREL